jgi:transcriptional regulator with XRE-family HTH domain
LKLKRKHLKTGQFLRSLRQKRKVSANELAGVLGWSGAEIAFLETGERRLSIWHTLSIVKALCSDAERSSRLAWTFREAMRLLCVDEGVPPVLVEYVFSARPQEDVKQAPQ